MGLLPSRSVEIQISNKTQNITLKMPRTYSDSKHSSASSKPELSPSSSDICHFQSRSWFCDVTGILVYEAESFALAIHFSNPIDYNEFATELGLELSPGKAHLGRLGDTYTRMANGTYSGSCLQTKYDSVVVDKSHGAVQVSDGPITVPATMSDTTNSLLEVVLEEQGGSCEEARIENLRLEKIEKLPFKTRHQGK